MLISSPRGWEIREAQATPEHVFMNRRAFLAAGAGAGALVAAPALALAGEGGETEVAHPTTDLYPATRNDAFRIERDITPENFAGRYNNFYEFGSHKNIWKAAQALDTHPWTVIVDGLVEKPFEIDAADLIRRMTLEERLYRHRCVEAWSMTAPWTGFAMKELIQLARPLTSARYVRLETFLDPGTARGQRAGWYPWPYVEGLTLAEATNELAFVVTGAYGKPLRKQLGAPIRLHLPWKYGFKSIKSIVRVEFTEKRPKSFWETVQGQEYGFWANVNPEVPHPRWSQATERVLGTDEKIPTRLFNGYAEWVSGLYKDMKGEKLFM